MSERERVVRDCARELAEVWRWQYDNYIGNGEALDVDELNFAVLKLEEALALPEATP